MRRILIPVLLLVGVLVLATAGLADPGGGGKGKKNGHNRFSAQIVVTDHGSCGNAWATDTSMQTWSVKKSENGTFRVTRKDKGTFVTLAGQSPGACDTIGKHGHTVTAGIHGKFRGHLSGTVSGGTFNPNGACTAECTNKDFIAGFFTAGSTFTCNQGYAGCRFNFEYTAQKQKKQKLMFHHWVDRGLDGVNETFIGDIANS